MTALSLILLAASGLISAVMTWIVAAAGRQALLLDSPGSSGHIKPGVRRVPNIGGVAIFWTFAAFVGAGVLLARVWPDALTGPFPALPAHIPGITSQTNLALAVLAGAMVLHIIGLIDDRRPLPPLPKLLVITAVSAFIVLAFDVRLLTLLDDRAGGRWLSVLLTVLWFVTVTNAMNFMDNMDGLSAGVSAVAGALFMVAALLNGQWFVAMMLAVLVGALLGFLVFNFPWPGKPARIFMGDGGSLVVGLLLAFLTVRTTYTPSTAGSDGTPPNWYAVFMPLCVLAVPLYDLISVTCIRLAQGKSPLVGDQQHFSHRLRAKGLSVRQTLAVIYGCAAVTGVGGILLGSLDGWRAALVGVQTLLVLVLLGIYEHASGKSARSGVGQ